MAGTYQGDAGFLVDTNIWVDCMDGNSAWQSWSLSQLQGCIERAPLHVNIIIFTELLLPNPDPQAIDDVFDVFEARRSPLPWGCAALTARAFSEYRRRGGTKTRPMPDFYIGAHAAVANLSVLTRDPAGYRSYYPKLRLISP